VLSFYFGDQFTFDVSSESLAGVTPTLHQFLRRGGGSGTKPYLRRATLPD